MSVNIKVVLEGAKGRVKPDLPSGGKDLSRHGDELDAAAKAAKVKRLHAFAHSYEEELDWAAKALGDPDTDAMSAEEEQQYIKRRDQMFVHSGKWYPAGEGLRTVTGLLDYLAGHPEVAGGPRGSVAEDLAAIRKVLEGAKKDGRRFRLRVS